jgi:hypothetical protein
MLITITSTDRNSIDLSVDPNISVRELKHEIGKLYGFKYFDVYGNTILESNQTLTEAEIRDGDILDVIPRLTPESKQLAKDSDEHLKTQLENDDLLEQLDNITETLNEQNLINQSDDEKFKSLDILFTDQPQWLNGIPLYFYYK